MLIEVVDEKGVELHFETLKAGSSFCVYSPFSNQLGQLVQIRADRIDWETIIEYVDRRDIYLLAKKYPALSEEIKKVQLLVHSKEKTDLDFFPYFQPGKFMSKARLRQV